MGTCGRHIEMFRYICNQKAASQMPIVSEIEKLDIIIYCPLRSICS